MNASLVALTVSAAVLAVGTTSTPTPTVRLASSASAPPVVPFEFSRIYWEYNRSANDLGVHVTLDGEDWTRLKIESPQDRTLFLVQGRGPYGSLGMTELFFEGAEPSLEEFPLADLLALFPEGEYEFEGVTVDGAAIEGEHRFSHAIPDGPRVFTDVGSNFSVRIRWNEVSSPPPGFPNRPIHISGYQVIVEPTFQVTLPASSRSVTVPPEFVQSLGSGVQKFEVLAIERSGNQTLTEGTFVLP